MVNDALIEAIAKKVDKLIAENKTLRGELRKVSAERDRELNGRKNAHAQIVELEKRISVLETKASMMGSRGDNRTARLRINRLIREIDNCIALMNKE